MGDGKSTLVNNMIHLIHQIADKENKPIVIIRKRKLDLLKFSEDIDKLPAGDYIMYYDDISFVTDVADKISKAFMKIGMANIRHSDEAQGIRRVIFIGVVHYTKSFDKFMRDADFYNYTGIGNEEKINAIGIFGKSQEKKIDLFQKRQKIFSVRKRIDIKNVAMKRGILTYYRDKPFRIALWGGVGVHLMVYSAPVHDRDNSVSCPICSEIKQDVDSTKLYDLFEKEFPDNNFKMLLRVALHYSGVRDVLEYRDKRVLDMFQFARSRFGFDMQKFADLISTRKTRNRSPKVLESFDGADIFHD